MQNYQVNANDYARRGNCGRNGRMNCQPVVSAPVCAPEPRVQCNEKNRADDMVLAMAYVPWQKWRKIYCPEQAFKTGTVFEELNKPFLGMGGCR